MTVNRNELIRNEALRLIDETNSKGITLRLLGGMAIYLSSPCTRAEPFAREIDDLDFVVSKRQAYSLEKLLEKIGYTGDREFNSIHGESRLLFYSDLTALDIFVGEFQQCQSINLEKYFTHSKITIPLADLLLTKLQIIQINKKDILDILALLYDHEVKLDGDENEVISIQAINEVVCNDWGWYTTCMDNLEKILIFIGESFDANVQKTLKDRIELIRSNAYNSKKSLKWTVRAKIGRKVQWYELPEEKFN
jgi:hypothetical protein